MACSGTSPAASSVALLLLCCWLTAMALPSVTLVCLLGQETKLFFIPLSKQSSSLTWLFTPTRSHPTLLPVTFDLYVHWLTCCLFLLFFTFRLDRNISSNYVSCYFYAHFIHGLCIFFQLPVLFSSSHVSLLIFSSSTSCVSPSSHVFSPLVLLLYKLFLLSLLKYSQYLTSPLCIRLYPALHSLFFYTPLVLFCFCLPGTPVFPLFPLWHHPVPPTASLCHRSGAGCLGFSLSGQEAARDSFDFRRRLLEGLEVPLAGVRYHSNPAPRVANLGPHWLKSASHPLPNSALCGL